MKRSIGSYRKTWIAGGITLLTGVLLIVPCTVAEQAIAPRLFSAVPDASPVVDMPTVGPTVIRSRLVTVDFESLAGTRLPAGAAAVDLNLFDDVSYIASKTRIQKRSASRYTWFGKIEGATRSQVIIVVDNGSMAANVTVDGSIYQVRAIGDDIHAVYEIDQSAFPEEGPPTVVELAAVAGEEYLLAPDNSCTTIDVMVVYTDDAAAASANIDTEIQLAIDETNQSYMNSNMNQRLRLVHSAEVDYAETGNNTDLGRLVNPSDGYLDDVHTWRNTYGADCVSLWVESLDACGWGRTMNTVSAAFEAEAFSEVARDCATGYYSFGHELGHNMAAHHDCYVDTSTSPYPYRHGYVNTDDEWRTIMAYNDECEDLSIYCERLQYWSNPSVTYGGDPMGLASGDCTSNNAQVLNNTAATVAAFRAQVVNNPPLSEPGGPYSAECAGATVTVSLDGSASSDPDPCDAVVYSWTTDCPGGSFDDPTSETPTLTVDSLNECNLVCNAILTVTDDWGASDSESATVTITDTTDPVIACPANVTVECSESTEPSNTGSATASDVCNPGPLVSYGDMITPGACPEEYTITRTWTATDACLNASSCAQIVDVVDTTPPVISCNAPSTIGPPDAPISFAASALDNCDGNPSVAITTFDCYTFTKKGKRIDKTESCVVEVDGYTITVLDTGGVGDYISWAVSASDSCGNSSAMTCEVEVVIPAQP